MTKGNNRLVVAALVLLSVYCGRSMGSEEANSLVAAIKNESSNVANAAIDRALKEGAVELIKHGLENPALGVRLKSAKLLESIGTESDVEALVEALGDSYYFAGGTEVENMAKDLRTSIRSALQRITELDLNSKDFESVTNSIDEWRKTKDSSSATER